jgi:hypothetical protein
MSTAEQAPPPGGDEHLAVSRIIVRPMGTPLPLGFLGLLVATVGFAAVQLHWIPAAQGRFVALGVLVFTVPVQFLASVLGFLARDPVAGTGMGVLAATWAASSVITLASPAGTTSPALGVLLVLAGLAMVVPAAAGVTKLAAVAVMGLSSLRFAVTGVAHLTSAPAWMTTAGWIGVLLGLVGFYAALAVELEDARHRTILPVWRRGPGSSVMTGSVSDELREVSHEAGVRKQL